MTEIVESGFQRLFEIRLLHHYWLDEGATVFDAIASQSKRDDRLLSYDVRPILTVTPTATTATLLNGLRCVYKNSSLGLIAALPKGATVPTDTTLQFFVTVQDPGFYNYTSLTLRRQKIYEIYYQPEDQIYRFKENAPVWSNLTGAPRGSGAGKALFLSREIPAPAADDQVESLVLSGSALLQLTGDQPGAGTQQLAAQAADLPVFAHQADPPPIAPPAGMTGAPARGVRLDDEIPDEAFALIQLSALRGDDPDYSFVDGGGQAKAACPVFQIRFKNRSTVRQYLDKGTGALISTEPGPLPMTYFGNAGLKRKPSEGLVKAVKNGNQVTQLVSEIFI